MIEYLELPIKQCGSIYTGFQFTYEVTDPDTHVVSEIPFPLTDYTAFAKLRPSPRSDTIWGEFTTENGRLVIEQDEGILRLVIDWNDADFDPMFAAAMASDECKVYAHFDLFLVPPNNPNVAMFEGKWPITLAVSRENDA